MMTAMEAISTSPLPQDQPRFDVSVPDGGYRWWYIDAVSDDGRNGIVIIAFIGSVFSPYYFDARAQGAADPLDHCAINVCLYSGSSKRWSLTERSHSALEQSAGSFRLGPSWLSYGDDGLRIEIDERSAPFRLPIRGNCRLTPDAVNLRVFELDAAGRHTWQPVAPSARIEVRMRQPGLHWAGHAYFDTNAGERPLEDDFRCWNWSRTCNSPRTGLTYAVTPLQGPDRVLCGHFGSDGELALEEVSPRIDLNRTGWRIERSMHSALVPAVVRTLEDTPFYARSLLSVGNNAGVARLAMHESLDLERFRSPWVRRLLPFRMRREA
jgi:carotenoid 1,2-hydratase